MKSRNKKKVLIVSRDAGGAEILSAYLKKFKTKYEWFLYLSGPAEKIFSRENLGYKIISQKLDYEKIINNYDPDIIMTGTGTTTFELDFIKFAKKSGIKCYSFLEHWVSYRERFGYPNKNWKSNLPDNVYVYDQYMYNIALKYGFPKSILRLINNPYFQQIRKDYYLLKKKMKNVSYKKGKLRILYVSDVIYECAKSRYNDPNYFGYTQYDVLKDLIRIFNDGNVINSIRVRLHPDEKPKKYLNILKNQSSKIYISPKENSLLEDCMSTDLVIGSQTMALLIPLIIKKPVISYIPSKSFSCPIPYKEIKRIRSFNALDRDLKSIVKAGL